MDARPARLPLVVLISGRGSNLQALVAASESGALPVEVRAVLSDRADAAGLEFARARRIAAECVPASGHADRAAYDAAMAERIDRYAPGLLVLAGFMRILGPAFVARYAGRMLNIHPSLLPRHRGLHTHRRVLEAGDAEHGASVHFVTAELDGGPVVLQGRLRVDPQDTEASLATRVLALEHRLLPQAVDWFARGRLALLNGAARLDGHALDVPRQLETADA